MMDSSMWRQYSESPKRYITYSYDHRIESGDILFIYCKNKNAAKNGFIAALRIGSSMRKNKKNIKLFNNLDFNKYYTKVDRSITLRSAARLIDVFNSIKIDLPGYTSANSFKMKYLKGVNVVVEMPYHGKYLMVALENFCDDADPPDPPDPSVPPDNEKKEEEQLDNEDEEEEVNPIVKKKKEGKNRGMIPIMVVPCKKFRFPKKEKIKYFKRHYTSCDTCSVTNNNNLELCSIIDTSRISFKKITDDDDINFVLALDAYFRLKRFIPLNYNDEGGNNHICILHVAHDHELYTDCLLIPWVVGSN